MNAARQHSIHPSIFACYREDANQLPCAQAKHEVVLLTERVARGEGEANHEVVLQDDGNHFNIRVDHLHLPRETLRDFISHYWAHVNRLKIMAPWHENEYIGQGFPYPNTCQSQISTTTYGHTHTRDTHTHTHTERERERENLLSV